MLDKNPTQHPSLVAVHRARSPRSGLQLGGRAKRLQEYVYLAGGEAFLSSAEPSSAESHQPIKARGVQSELIRKPKLRNCSTLQVESHPVYPEGLLQGDGV